MKDRRAAEKENSGLTGKVKALLCAPPHTLRRSLKMGG